MYILADQFRLHYEYTQGIAFEYSHIPAKDYREGRIEFLEKLAAEPIFCSTTFVGHRNQAIYAIQKEISSLRLLSGISG